MPAYGDVHQQRQQQQQQRQRQDREQQPDKAVASKDLSLGGSLSAIEQRPGARGGMPPMDREFSGGALLLDDSSLGGLLLDCVPAGEAAANPLHIIAASIKVRLASPLLHMPSDTELSISSPASPTQAPVVTWLSCITTVCCWFTQCWSRVLARKCVPGLYPFDTRRYLVQYFSAGKAVR